MRRRGGASVRQQNLTIIADRAARATERRIVAGVCLAAALVGLGAAAYYARLGLTLSHYDARAHLVVTRRITDSLTPGWRQLGAVWLPLPHLLNLLPLQFDWSFRTGFASVGLSVASLSVGLGMLAGYLYRRTQVAAAALVAPGLILLNPNVLYLQSTPMTEPLLFGLAFVALAAVDRWMDRPSPRSLQGAGGALFLLALTRYEGWAIAVALVAAAAYVRRDRGTAALAASVLSAIALFLLLGYGATGQWFVSSGFFVPDNPSRHSVASVLDDVFTSTRELGGDVVVFAGLGGCLVSLVMARTAPWAFAPLALYAAAALPLAAFYEGHPHRVRYMVPLVAASGVLAAVGVARLPRRLRTTAAAVLCAMAWYSCPPLDRKAPMVTEAQWETPFRLGRQSVTEYLEGAFDGTPILASMGSLAHYMQEASAHGFHLRDFLHEGNGDLWAAALEHPRRYVHWIAIEERAEGGDVLALKARADPAFLEGFTRVAEGGGVVLYKRVPANATNEDPLTAAALAGGDGPCLPYLPDRVSLSGTIRQMTFAGPPGYKSIAAGDAEETGYYLALDVPVCLDGDPKDDTAYPQKDVRLVQLALDLGGEAAMTRSLGRVARLSGALFAAHTMHHHAPVVMTEVVVDTATRERADAPGAARRGAGGIRR